MNTQQLIDNLVALLGRIVAAGVVLLIGWVIAKIVAALVGKLLRWVRLDERIGKAAGDEKVPKVGDIITKLAYYIILLFAVVGALQVLGLTTVTEPLNAMLGAAFAYLPSLIAGIVVIVIAWLVATILRAITRRLLEGLNADKKVTDAANVKQRPVSRMAGEAVFYLVWLLFLPVILETFGLTGLVAPVTSLLSQIFSWIPNLIVAGLIVLVGGFVARIIQVVVTNFFAAIGTDRLADRIGLSKYMGKQTLSSLIGLVLFVIMMIPIITAGLQALGLTALTAPLTAMLTAILLAIPVVIVAIIVIVIAYFVGRVMGDFVASLLNGFGFDNVLMKLGLAKAARTDGRTPSKVVGWLVMVSIILAAALAAFDMLRLEPLSALLSQFIVFAFNVLIGLVVFGVGLWIASWVSDFVLDSNWPRKRLLAIVMRVAIIALALAMALTQMGLADSIVAIAFGVPLLGVALAIGLAFGMGGREAASGQIASWQGSLKKVDDEPAMAMATVEAEPGPGGSDMDTPASDPAQQPT